jgi:TetR/AcrR family transcriptional repressor of mexCD-oprJ operon
VSAVSATRSAPNRADELRRQVAQRNVEAIVDAALSLLEHDPKASLVEIAKAAGVSRPTLYAHFPTREDLVEATVKRALDDAQQEFAAADADDGPAKDALQRLITAGWRTLARHLTIARLALDVLPPKRLRQVHQPALDPFRRLIVRGQHTGEFRDDQPVEWMVTVLFALLHAAADGVTTGLLNRTSAAELIYGSTLAAFQPTNSTPTTTTRPTPRRLGGGRP